MIGGNTEFEAEPVTEIQDLSALQQTQSRPANDFANDLRWLGEWYLSQCNGVWEHCYGIEISMIDNPGWKVLIDLTGTRYDGAYSTQNLERSDSATDWIRCRIADQRFEGFGDPSKLAELVSTFRNWIVGF